MYRIVSLNLFCLVFSCICNAQYQAATWILGGEVGLSFVDEKPSLFVSPVSSAGGCATYSNLSGEPMIYWNGRDVRDKNGKPFKNGTNIFPSSGHTMIVPKPMEDSVFYLFSIIYNQTASLTYSILDLRANGKQGEVLERGQILYTGMHGSFAVSGNCDGSLLWLIGDVDSNVQSGSDRQNIFRIDKDGISFVRSALPTGISIGNSSGYTFSPNAKKVIFSIDGNADTRMLLVDFNPSAFQVYSNLRTLPFGRAEFSRDSKFLYIYDFFFRRLIQYDIDNNLITELFKPTAGSGGFGELQMASNGKIYVMIQGLNNLMVINEPNKRGLSCGFEQIGVPLPQQSFLLPKFPAHFFFQGNLIPNAGPDLFVCPKEQVTIGTLDNPAGQFQWFPNRYLTNINLLTPTFTHIDTTQTRFPYRLSYQDGSCLVSDMMVVNIAKRPDSPIIIGSRSVCPGVVGVDYWTISKAGIQYKWSASGGNISKISVRNDSAKVDWGVTNANANVRLMAIDERGCKSDVANFGVRINVVLKTQKPSGLDSICVNLLNREVTYLVERTNGSTYQWDLRGGTVVDGQGSFSAKIRWQNDAPNWLRVKESSITRDTVCFGSSDTLKVAVFKDPAIINLEWVSIDTTNESTVLLKAKAIFPQRIEKARVFTKELYTANWNAESELKVNPIIDLEFPELQTNQNVYEFKLGYTNKCEEEKETFTRNTILLKGSVSESENTINLLWNPYQFGSNENSSYDIFQSGESDKPFEYLKSVSDTVAIVDGSNSFSHRLRVRANSTRGGLPSFSNSVKLDFEHQLFLPNVITPNQDTFNDCLVIRNLKLYQPNILTIYNRYGTILFQQRNYENDWCANGVADGTYFYDLQLVDSGKRYKGWIQVIR